MTISISKKYNILTINSDNIDKYKYKKDNLYKIINENGYNLY